MRPIITNAPLPDIIKLQNWKGIVELKKMIEDTCTLSKKKNPKKLYDVCYNRDYTEIYWRVYVG